MMKNTALLAVAALLLSSPAAFAAPVRIAVFGFELFDDTLDDRPTVHAEQAQRLRLVNDELNRLLAASDHLAAVNLEPQAGRIETLAPLFKCNGCELDVARDMGAELEIVGVIRKISNLILSFTLVVRATDADGRVVRAGQVDIRGNTDESWLRAVRYLVKNRIFAPNLPPLAP